MIATLLAGLLAVAAEKAPPPVLQGSGKWNVDYAPTNCTLGKRFADGKPGDEDDTILMFRAIPLEDSVEVLLGLQSFATDFRRGDAQVSLSSGGSATRGYEGYPTKTRGRYLVKMRVLRSMFETLPRDTQLTLALDAKAHSRTLHLVNASAAFAALDTCNDATAKQWGIDPSERQRIATPATPVGGGEASWLKESDYPSSAVMSGAQGATIVLFAIGTDGGVGDCRVVVTSGVKALDEQVCQAVTRRARYRPAIGTDGAPVISHSTLRVVWMLDGAWRDTRD